MDTQALAAFRAVAETGSFSQAAERLFITQPAISKRIAALETQLGAKLFDRIGRRSELTQAGQLLLPRAVRILDEIRESRQQISNLSNTVAGRLTLATSHHIGLHRLPPILQAFRQRYPDVQLDLHFLASETACEKVAAGQLEMAVVTLPQTAQPGLRAEPVWNDPLSFVTSAAETPPETLEALARQGAILPTRNTVTRRLIESAFDQAGLPLRVIMETNYLETIRKMVEIGIGWSALPDTMLDQRLTRAAIQGVTIQRRLGLVTSEKRTPSNAARALRRLLLS